MSVTFGLEYGGALASPAPARPMARQSAADRCAIHMQPLEAPGIYGAVGRMPAFGDGRSRLGMAVA